MLSEDGLYSIHSMLQLVENYSAFNVNVLQCWTGTHLTISESFLGEPWAKARARSFACLWYRGLNQESLELLTELVD